jgi:hypothetical protein
MKRFNILAVASLFFASTVMCGGMAGATTLGYFRAEDGPGSSHSTWVNSANASTPGTSTGSSPVQNSTEVFGSVVPLTGAANTGSYYLDGTNAIQIGGSSDYNIGTNDFTIEFWFRTAGSSAAHPIVISKSSYATSHLGWGASIEDHNRDYIGGGVKSGIGDTGVGGLIPEDVVDNNWRHFAMVLDRTSGEFREYLDGELRITDAWIWGDADVISTQSVYIGRRSGSTVPGHFAGYIDELRISRAALQPSQFLNAIPEPNTALLLGIGLSALAVRREKR